MKFIVSLKDFLPHTKKTISADISKEYGQYRQPNPDTHEMDCTTEIKEIGLGINVPDTGSVNNKPASHSDRVSELPLSSASDGSTLDASGNNNSAKGKGSHTSWQNLSP